MNIKLLLFGYFLLSGIVPSGSSGMLSRVGYADIMMLFITAFLFINIAKRGCIYFDNIHKALFAYICLMFLSTIISNNIIDSSIEAVAHLFLFICYLSLCNILYNLEYNDLEVIALAWVLSCVIIGLYSLYLFVFMGVSGELTNALVGTFRNTGQAGYFFFCGLTISLPLALFYDGTNKNIYILASLILTIVLFLTLKRSAILGFFVGAFLVLLNHAVFGTFRERFKLAVFGSVLFISILNLLLFFLDKFEPLLLKFMVKSDQSSASKFIGENVVVAFNALSDNLFFGAGPGGIIGFYSKQYEIHSTYLAVIGTLGLVGFVLYLLFFFNLFKVFFKKPFKAITKSSILIRDIGLMFVGQAVCWGYTTHLRKREFWITLAIATAIAYAVNRGNFYYKDKADATG